MFLLAEIDANGWSIIIAAAGFALTNLIVSVAKLFLDFFVARAATTQVKAVQDDVKETKSLVNGALGGKLQQISEQANEINRLDPTDRNAESASVAKQACDDHETTRRQQSEDNKAADLIAATKDYRKQNPEPNVNGG